MDRASQVLAQGVPLGMSKSYRTLADYGQVSYSILYYCVSEQSLLEDKAQGQ